MPSGENLNGQPVASVNRRQSPSIHVGESVATVAIGTARLNTHREETQSAPPAQRQKLMWYTIRIGHFEGAKKKIANGSDYTADTDDTGENVLPW